MTAGWEYPVAAFRRGANQPPVGAGVLVAGDFVLTCAHVVEDVLKGTGSPIGLGSKTSIDFPFANVTDLQTEVVGWHPVVSELNLRGDGAPTDLAVLKLSDPERAGSIEACLIAQTDVAAGLAFACQGFPKGYPKGALAEGVLRGADSAGWLDTVPDQGFGHFIEPGVSGAPMFARGPEGACGGTVLGLSVTADSGRRPIARTIPPAQLAAALRAVVSPYRWLEYFDQRDAAYFFGRDELIEELSLHLGQHRFLVLAGPSGSGKSSLLRAGLLNAARRSGNETLVIRPLDNVWRELGRQLGLPADPVPSEEAVRHALEARLLGARRLKKTLLLGIDQAEELVQAPRRAYAAEFLQFLAELRDENVELQITLATRSDALPLLLAAQPRSPRLVERNLRYVRRARPERIASGLRTSGCAVAHRVGSWPVRDDVNDALQEPRVPLPVFQLCLSKLSGIANRHGDHCRCVPRGRWFDRRTGATRRSLLKQIRPDSQTLLKLVDIGVKGADRRRRIPLSDFGASGERRW